MSRPRHLCPRRLAVVVVVGGLLGPLAPTLPAGASGALPAAAPGARAPAAGFFEITAGSGQYLVESGSSGARRVVYTVPPWVQNAQDEAGFSGVNLGPGAGRFVTVDPDLGLEVGATGNDAAPLLPNTLGDQADISNLPVWSPDGADLAVPTQAGDGDYTDGLYIARANGSGYRQVRADGVQASANAVAWSPDGDALAIWAQKPPAEQWGPSTLEIIDLLTGRSRALATVPASLVPEGVFWSAAGTLVVSLADNGGSGGPTCGCQVRQVPVGGGRLAPLAHPVPARDGLWQLSPDGRTIVVRSPQGHLLYLDLDGSVVAGPSRAPSGWAQWVAAAAAPPSLFDRHWVTPLRPAPVPPIVSPLPPPPRSYRADGIVELAYAPSDISPIVSKYFSETPAGTGRRLVYTTPVVVLDGEVLGSDGFYGGAVVAPGGGTVADLSSATSALEVGPAGGVLHQLWPRHGDGVAQGWGGAPVWSPDGRDVAVATNGWDNGNSSAAGLDIINITSGRSEPVLAGGLVDGPAWSPDGDELAVWTAPRPGNDDERSTLQTVNLMTGAVKKLATIDSYLVPETMFWAANGLISTNIYNSHLPSTGGVVLDQVPAQGGRLSPWSPWPSLVASKLSTSNGVWLSPTGAQVLVDRGGSFVVLDPVRRLYTVATPDASVLGWVAGTPAAESKLDRAWR